MVASQKSTNAAPIISSDRNRSTMSFIFAPLKIVIAPPHDIASGNAGYGI